jgi:hypothetical protein
MHPGGADRLLVPFEMHYELMEGKVWKETLFNDPFTYRAEGWVDFTRTVPEPSSSLLSILGLGAVLFRRHRRSI